MISYINGYPIEPHANLRKADLHGANLHGANLVDANLTRANLVDANLTRANLVDANLSRAYLVGANLAGANLAGANLAGAYLHGANLAGANLDGAYLHGANLSPANLTRANLLGADLSSADLAHALLPWADLTGAILRGANFFGASLVNARGSDVLRSRLQMCPETGAFDAWKKLEGGMVAHLRIPASAKRSSATTRKCRASAAKVLAIYDKDGKRVLVGRSRHVSGFLYEVGKTVRPREPFDEDWRNECSYGIHFFITREEAEQYYG